MIGKDNKRKVKKGQERERKRNTDDRDVCNIEEKEVPGAVLISLHMFYILQYIQYSSKYLFFKSESGI